MALQDRTSWTVKDTALLPELVALIGITHDEAALLRAHSEQARQAGPELITLFYGRLFGHGATAEYLHGVAMERLHSMVADWFVELFSGQYDEAYVQRRLAIGHIHVRIGLPVRYPLAMLDLVLTFGRRIVQQSDQPEQALAAFEKIISLDVALFNQAYEDHQLNHLARLVGNERLARRLLTMER